MDNTWANPATGTSWPQLMANDPALRDYDVFVYGYYSPAVGDASDIYEIATRMEQEIRDAGMFQDYKEIYFVTHSMGGLVTKRMMTALNTPRNETDLEKVRCVIYISVPSNGADVSSLAAWISLNPQFSSMKAGDSNNFLQAIEGDWRSLLNARTPSKPFPRTFSAYEKQATHHVHIVPALYISQLSDLPVIAYDYDHSRIVKPDGLGDPIYIWVRARIIESSKIKQDAGETVNKTSDPVIPPLISNGAAIGTTYQYNYLGKLGLHCLSVFVKVSQTEWNEMPSSDTPEGCREDAGVFLFTERQSEDPRYFLLYDASRQLFGRLKITNIGEISPQTWRLVTADDQWNSGVLVTRIK